MKMEMRHPARVSPRGLPAVQIGNDYVSVNYGLPGRFVWYLDCESGESFSGITPATPSRYMNGLHLDAVLASVLYCLLMQVRTNPPIQNLMRFPFGAMRWAVNHHMEISGLVDEMRWQLGHGESFIRMADEEQSEAAQPQKLWMQSNLEE